MGNFLKPPPSRLFPALLLLALGCDSGDANRLPVAGDLKPTRPSPRAEAATSTGDLLGRLNVAQDIVSGAWGFHRGELYCQASAQARLQLPILPPEEYDLNITAFRKQGSKALFVGVVHAARHAVFAIDGGSGLDTWLYLHPSGDLESNTTLLKEKVLTGNGPVRIRVSVRKTELSLMVDGKKRIHWTGHPSELAAPSSLRMPDPRLCFLGSDDSMFAIAECSLVPVSGESRPLR